MYKETKRSCCNSQKMYIIINMNFMSWIIEFIPNDEELQDFMQDLIFPVL